MLASGDCIIEDNLIENSNVAIFCTTEIYRNTITRNTIKNNIHGLYLLYATHNIIYSNNFIDNTEHILDRNGENTYNLRIGNYYSDYNELYPHATSININGYEIWNTPYQITDTSFDNNPLVNIYQVDNIVNDIFTIGSNDIVGQKMDNATLLGDVNSKNR